MNDTLKCRPIPTDNSWTEAFKKYLNDHHSFHDQPNLFERLKNFGEIPPQDIIKSHNHFFNNIFHSLESKRPVQNIYKRPI
jgi:hypothetical protein